MNYSFIDRYKNSDFVPAGNLIYDNDTRPKNDIKNYNYWSIKQDKDNWATDNSIQKTLLQGTYTPTPLGELFFSRKNIERLQKLIKKEVYVRTDGKYKLDVEQDESDLLVVMRAIYFAHCKNLPQQTVRQVKMLNDKTVDGFPGNPEIKRIMLNARESSTINVFLSKERIKTTNR